MAKTTLLDVVLDALNNAGISYQVLQGKHYKVRFLLNGKTETIVVARTASDHRAIKNTRALIKRTLNNPKKGG